MLLAVPSGSVVHLSAALTKGLMEFEVLITNLWQKEKEYEFGITRLRQMPL